MRTAKFILWFPFFDAPKSRAMRSLLTYALSLRTMNRDIIQLQTERWNESERPCLLTPSDWNVDTL